MKLNKTHIALIALIATAIISSFGFLVLSPNEYFTTNSPKEYVTNFNMPAPKQVLIADKDKCNCKLGNFTQCSNMAKTICLPNGVNTPFYQQCYEKVVDACWGNSFSS